MRALSGLVLLLLLARPERADACACCGAVTAMKPLGWTEAGGAVLLEQTSNAACVRQHELVVWHVGKAAPAGCYDLLGNPDTRVACGTGDAARQAYDVKPRRSQAEKTFPRAPSKLEASKVRMKSRVTVAAGTKAYGASLRVEVEVETGGTWQQVWSGALEDVREGTLGVTLWPTPGGDRALMLLRAVYGGTAHTADTVHWVQLPAPPSKP
jgi:hypothetical protein